MNSIDSIESRNWRNVDLNLLIAFHYLYRSRSVSVAAEQAHVSQSAMSHSLNKLRTLFDDPLFYRRSHQMHPTEYSELLAPKVQRILAHIDQELSHNHQFVPSSFSGQFKIGLTDYAEWLFAPMIYDHLHNLAPQAQILFHNINRDNYQGLFDKQRIDVAIVGFSPSTKGFQHQKLYTEEHVVLFDPKMVELQQLSTAKGFASIAHALVSPDGSVTTKVDAALSELNLTRRVTTTSANFMSISRLIQGRSIVATLPERLALALSQHHPLSFCPTPIDMAGFDVSLISEHHQHTTQKVQWLTSELLTLLQKQ
jgi:DNA-binding transcriptional LysR family regulator